MDKVQGDAHEIAAIEHAKEHENLALRDTLREILLLDRLGLLADILSRKITPQDEETTLISDGLLAALQNPGQQSVNFAISNGSIRLENDVAPNNPFNISMR